VHESIILPLPPPTCNARTIAMLLHVYCAIYDAPPTPLLYAIHHTILAMAISCKGQASGGSFFCQFSRIGRAGSGLTRQNRLNMNRIPYDFLGSVYPTRRLVVLFVFVFAFRIHSIRLKTHLITVNTNYSDIKGALQLLNKRHM